MPRRIHITIPIMDTTHIRPLYSHSVGAAVGAAAGVVVADGMAAAVGAVDGMAAVVAAGIIKK
jgi:hypothetical protein